MSLPAPPSVAAALARYVPALAAARLRASPCAAPRDDTQRLRSTAALFADISGFTALCDALHGDNEALARTLNKYVSLMGRLVSAAGGDIVAFAGDALLVVWPCDEGGGSGGGGGGLRDRVARAGQCALQLQAHLHRAQLDVGTCLSVKIGVGVGDVALLHMGGDGCSGGVTGGRACVAVGTALSQAFAAEHAAEAGGDALLSPDAARLVSGDFQLPPQEEEEKDAVNVGGAAARPPACVRIAVDGLGVCLRPHKQVGVAAIAQRAGSDGCTPGERFPTPDAAASSELLLASRLLPYVCPLAQPWLAPQPPHAPQPSRQAASSQPQPTTSCSWLSQLRTASVLFAHLGIAEPQLAAHSVKHAAALRAAFAAVQAAVAAAGGCVCKLLCDDKGAVCIAVFGLSGEAGKRAAAVCAEDAGGAQRLPLGHCPATAAVVCALDVCARLGALRLRGSVGVAHGPVFVGVVGGSVRREVTVLGAAVNMAARLMQHAGTAAAAGGGGGGGAATGGGVFCDEPTRANACPALAFTALEPVAVKGRAGALLVCQPYPPACVSALAVAAAAAAAAAVGTSRRGGSFRVLRTQALTVASSSSRQLTAQPAAPQSPASVFQAALAAQTAAVAAWATAHASSPFSAWSPLLARALHAAHAHSLLLQAPPHRCGDFAWQGLMRILRPVATHVPSASLSVCRGHPAATLEGDSPLHGEGSPPILDGECPPSRLTATRVLRHYALITHPALLVPIAAVSSPSSAYIGLSALAMVDGPADAARVIAATLHWRGPVSPALVAACLAACGGSALALQELTFALLQAGQLQSASSALLESDTRRRGRRSAAIPVPTPTLAAAPAAPSIAACGLGPCLRVSSSSSSNSSSSCSSNSSLKRRQHRQLAPSRGDPSAVAASASSVPIDCEVIDNPIFRALDARVQHPSIRVATDIAASTSMATSGIVHAVPALSNDTAPPAVCHRELRLATEALEPLLHAAPLNEGSAAFTSLRLRLPRELVEEGSLYTQVQLARIAALPPHVQVSLRVLAVAERELTDAAAAEWRQFSDGRSIIPALSAVQRVVGVPAPLLRLCLQIAQHAACAATPTTSPCGRPAGPSNLNNDPSSVQAAVADAPECEQGSIDAELDDTVGRLVDSGLVCSVASGLLQLASRGSSSGSSGGGSIHTPVSEEAACGLLSDSERGRGAAAAAARGGGYYALHCRITSAALVGSVLQEQAAPILRCIRAASGQRGGGSGATPLREEARPPPPQGTAAQRAAAGPAAAGLRMPPAPRCRLAVVLPQLRPPR